MAVLFALVAISGCNSEEKTLRLLHWNIQNGMWDGQNDNYDRFVEFVKAQNPDVCMVRSTVHMEDGFRPENGCGGPLSCR